MTESETDEYVSKRLGVPTLHARIEKIEALLEEALRAHDKRLLAHRERLNALDENVVALKERIDGHVRRMDYLGDKDVDLSARISVLEDRDARFAKSLGKQGARIGVTEEAYRGLDNKVSLLANNQKGHRARIENLQDGAAGERRWRNRKADQVRLWLYALAGVAGAGLVIDVLTEVIWGG